MEGISIVISNEAKDLPTLRFEDGSSLLFGVLEYFIEQLEDVL
jgi:hypothetical protein